MTAVVRTGMKRRGIVLELARHDFHVRYSGSVFGALWAFVQPVLTILLYLFIDQIGFRSTPPQAVPFVLWLIVGIAPWFFFVDGLTSTTLSFLEYSFLVKKVMFNVAIIPLVKLVSTAFIHVVVWAIVVVVLLASGRTPGLAWLQVPYYFAAMFALLLGLGRITGVLTAFFRDLGQIVGIVLQFGFWLTPVLWPIANAPARYRPYLELNPVFYVVEGLRDALLMDRSLFSNLSGAAWFWGIVVALHVAGYFLFAKLRPVLADVL
jgi:teichoic acid transport system permease protein